MGTLRAAAALRAACCCRKCACSCSMPRHASLWLTLRDRTCTVDAVDANDDAVDEAVLGRGVGATEADARVDGVSCPSVAVRERPRGSSRGARGRVIDIVV